jgi:cytochrome P450
VVSEGWTKASIMKMRKLDSFLKESIRIHPLGQSFPPRPHTLTVVGSVRRAMTDYTFSDGTVVPKGTLLAAPVSPIQFDDTIYSNPDVFDGFRFSNLRAVEGESAKHHSSNTATEFLHFGHGMHAWYRQPLRDADRVF